MRTISVISMISLDGVLQAPGGPEEDPSNGFQFGGWIAPFVDEEGNKVAKKQMEPREYLLGRKTFDIWEHYWPLHADIWPGINQGTKYILSKTRKSTEWSGTVFLDSLEAIKELKQTEGPELQVWGSSELIQLLLHHDLVDELCLKIYPITLGQGKKLFQDGPIPAGFALRESTVTSKGVIIATYQRAGKVETGDLTV